MARVSGSVVIDAPVATVYDFVVSEWHGSLRFWRYGIRRWRPTPGRPLGVGFRVRYVAQVLAVPFPVEMEIVEFVAGRRWVARSVRGPRAQGRWEFEPEGTGTRITHTLDYDMPPPLLGPLLDRLLFAPAWRRAIAASLDELARLVAGRTAEDGATTPTG